MTDRAGHQCSICGKKTRFNQIPWAHEDGDTIVLVLHDEDGGAACPANPRYDTKEYVKNLEKTERKVLTKKR